MHDISSDPTRFDLLKGKNRLRTDFGVVDEKPSGLIDIAKKLEQLDVLGYNNKLKESRFYETRYNCPKIPLKAIDVNPPVEKLLYFA